MRPLPILHIDNRIEITSAALLLLLVLLRSLDHLVPAQLHPAALHLARHLVALVDLLYQVVEGFVDVFASQRAHSKELAVVLRLQPVDSLFVLLQLLVEAGRREEVALVAEEDLGDLVAAVEDELLQPGLGVVEGVLVAEVEDDAGGLGEREVIIDDGPVALLAGRIPQF